MCISHHDNRQAFFTITKFYHSQKYEETYTESGDATIRGNLSWIFSSHLIAVLNSKNNSLEQLVYFF